MQGKFRIEKISAEVSEQLMAKRQNRLIFEWTDALSFEQKVATQPREPMPPHAPAAHATVQPGRAGSLELQLGAELNLT